MSIEGTNDASPQAPEAPAKPKSKVIKRYSNRKLYDTDRSKYVTLDEIAKMIKAGEEITIIDNESKEDLTSVTLTQIIYEEEKRESRMPLGMLRNLIQTGGASLQEFFDKQVKTPALEMQKNVEKSVEKSVEDFVQSATQIREAATRSMTGITESARRMFSREERKAEEFRKTTTALFDQLDQHVEQRATDVHDALAQAQQAAKEQPAPTPDANGDAAAPVDVVSAQRERLAVADHVGLLRGRLEQLATRLEALEQAGQAEPAAPAEAAPEPAAPEASAQADVNPPAAGDAEPSEA